MDLNLVLGYWGGGGKRSYHHTAPVNTLYALHEALVILLVGVLMGSSIKLNPLGWLGGFFLVAGYSMGFAGIALGVASVTNSVVCADAESRPVSTKATMRNPRRALIIIFLPWWCVHRLWITLSLLIIVDVATRVN